MAEKIFPAVIFANKNLSQNRFRVCRREQEVNKELADNLTEILSS